MKFKRSLCWIRRDLRLNDHRALEQACSQSEEVVIAFVFDETILKKLPKQDKRVSFIHDALSDLDRRLSEHGSALLWLTGNPVDEIPQAAKDFNVQAVFTNEDYEPSAKKRDLKVASLLKKSGMEFFSFKDQVIFSGSEVLKDDGKPYRVFTPYKNAWLKKFKKTDAESLTPNIKKILSSSKWPKKTKKPALKDLGFETIESGVEACERAADAQLKSFLKELDQYHSQRDFPSIDGTSRLSVHLRFGTVSIRKCVRAAMQNPSEGSRIWLSELIWRDFYHMILDQYPHVEEKSFLPQYESIKWPGETSHFKAWCEGKTGFPIVDAAMRQLNQTGWMHNRLRMIVASFLVKDLLVNWLRHWFHNPPEPARGRDPTVGSARS
jgi:deoxyribodipyrimidine photo-lyase